MITRSNAPAPSCGSSATAKLNGPRAASTPGSRICRSPWKASSRPSRPGKYSDGVDFDLVLTSPLRRARRTAELAGFPDAEQEPLAVEWNYGDYEGISSDLIRKDNPEYLIWTHGVPNGEALDEVAARADKIMARVLESGLDNVLMVAHGHFSRILTARWLGIDPRRGPALRPGDGEGLHPRAGTRKHPQSSAGDCSSG